MEVEVEGEEEEGDIEGKILPFTLDLTQPSYRSIFQKCIIIPLSVTKVNCTVLLHTGCLLIVLLSVTLGIFLCPVAEWVAWCLSC